MKSAKSEKFDEGMLYYDLAEYLGIPGPLEGIDPFDFAQQDIDLSGWLETSLWNALEQGKAVLPRTLKLRILAGVYYAEDYEEFETVRERWNLIVDRLRAVEPIVSDDEIDDFFETYPDVAIARL